MTHSLLKFAKPSLSYISFVCVCVCAVGVCGVQCWRCDHSLVNVGLGKGQTVQRSRGQGGISAAAAEWWEE